MVIMEELIGTTFVVRIHIVPQGTRTLNSLTNRYQQVQDLISRCHCYKQMISGIANNEVRLAFHIN